MAADRISELPVDILLLILSFLPTEDAVVTSLVSKRWRPLWLSVLTLNFDRERYLQRRRQYGFTDFICATIQARGSHPPIKQFCLACDPRESHAKEILLNYALLGEVETVEIENFPPHELPSSILNCTKLVVLKLCYSSFHKDFSSVYLPSLKTLHLKVIGFVKPQCFMDFLYGCPILEDLQANYGFFYGDGSFEGEFKSLSKLVSAVVCNLQGFHIPVKVFSNVKFLTLDQCDDELLQCDDEDIPMFPNLIHLELICEDNCDGLKWNSVLDILNYSPNLQKFVLQFPYSFREDWPNPQFVSECFSSQLTECVIKIYSRRANQMTFAKYVMQNSTSLQTMTIFCSSYPYRSRDEDWKKYMLLELASCPMSSATCELLLK